MSNPMTKQEAVADHLDGLTADQALAAVESAYWSALAGVPYEPSGHDELDKFMASLVYVTTAAAVDDADQRAGYQRTDGAPPAYSRGMAFAAEEFRKRRGAA